MTRMRAGWLVLVAALALGAGPAGAARDSVVVGSVLEPPGLDPTAGAASAIREVTYGNLYEGLTRIDEAGAVQPALAESWTVSADGLVYTFKLHAGVTFHDGTPFDCAVVKFSYDRAVAPDSVNAQKGLFEPIAGTACPDRLTAVVTLKRPTGNFLFAMAWGDAVMLAPNSVGTDKTDPIGTGPFKFVRWRRGDRIELARNDAYWGPRPKLAAVTFRFVADPSAATEALLAGDLDAFPDFTAYETLGEFRADPRFIVTAGTSEGKLILALNAARKPFDDVRVRRALAYAIDRQGLNDALFAGLATPIGAHYTPGDQGYVDLAGTYPHDPAKAKALLADAGVQPGAAFTIMLPPPSYARRGGEVIAAMLQQVGITARLAPIEWAQWLDQVFTRSDFDATIIDHDETRDLDIYARDKYYFQYDSAEYKAVYRQYLATTDPARRNALVVRLQDILARDEPNVFLLALPRVGVRNAKLHGLWTNAPLPTMVMSGAYWSD